MALNNYKSQVCLVFFFLVLAISLPSFSAKKTSVAKAKGTQFSIDWNYEKFPLKVEMYEIKDPGKYSSQSMGRFKSKSNAILANKITGNLIFVPDEDIYRFALVIENTTKKAIYFYVVPHEITPAEYSLGAKFVCLCLGHIYSVPPGEIWYRIVSLQNLTPKLGNDFKIRHRVVGVDIATAFKDKKEFQESD